MATYDYYCEKCDKTLEIIHKMTENPDVFCDSCNEKMRRLITGGQGYILTSGSTRNQTWETRHGHKKTSNQLTPSESANEKAKEILKKDQLQKDEIKFSSFKLRLWNEVATIFLVAIVFVVVLKNTTSFIWGILGLLLLGGTMFIAASMYKKGREKKKEQE